VTTGCCTSVGKHDKQHGGQHHYHRTDEVAEIMGQWSLEDCFDGMDGVLRKRRRVDKLMVEAVDVIPGAEHE
jgi:hypothetical protein